MNYLVIIDRLIVCLQNNGELKASLDLLDLKTSASTGTELIMSITYILVELTKSSSKMNELIKEDTATLVSYCKEMGLNLSNVE